MILLQSATSPFQCAKLVSYAPSWGGPLLTRLAHVFWWFLGVKHLTTKMKEKRLFHEEKRYWNNVIPNQSYGYGSTIGVPTCALFLGPQQKIDNNMSSKKMQLLPLLNHLLWPWDAPYMHLPLLLTSPFPTSLPGGYPRTKFHLADDLQRLRKAACNSSWYELYWTVIREIPQHYHKLVYNSTV